MTDKAGVLGWVRGLIARVLGKWGARDFEGADTGRLYTGWLTSRRSANEEIRYTLSTMRARSRDLEINNPYAQRFFQLCDTNIVGTRGIAMQNKAKDFGSKRLDTAANDKIERAWQRWCRPENCTVDGKQSFSEFLSTGHKALVRDGEVLVRRVPGYDNEFRFALQLLEADHLDHTFNDDLANGNRVVMGIEVNGWGKPVAYHVWSEHPGDYNYQRGFSKRVRLDAANVQHVYVRDRVGQLRGIPWLHAALAKIKMLHGYEQAEVVAARAAASKMGFIIPPEGGQYVGDQKTGAGDWYENARPGEQRVLPPGSSVSVYDPKHPTANHAAFMEVGLRGIAAAVGVSYHTLANDLTGVNYTSGRLGSLDDRDLWIRRQEFAVANLCTPVFEPWLLWCMITGMVPLPVAKYDKFNAPVWRTKRWQWTDPVREIEANRRAVAAGFKSATQVVAETGSDIETVLDEIAAERVMAAEKGITLDYGSALISVAADAAQAAEGEATNATDTAAA